MILTKFLRWERARGHLSASIECVLLDHVTELDGDNADANLAELAFVYKQVTGWSAMNPV